MKKNRDEFLKKAGKCAEAAAKSSVYVAGDGYPCLFILGEEKIPESLKRMKK